MEEIKQQLEQVQQENLRLSQSLTKLESSFIGVSSTRGSFGGRSAVIESQVVCLSIVSQDLDTNEDDVIKFIEL